MSLQWNPSCEATPLAPEKWPFKSDGISSEVENYYITTLVYL